MIAVKRGVVTDYFVVPLDPSPRIVEAVEPFQGDFKQAVYVSFQRENLRSWMREESVSASVLMLVLLVVGVVGGAWKIAGTIQSAPASGSP